VTLVGVPGIGKSRLLYELSRIADAEPHLISWRQGHSLPYGEGISFWALAEMVKAQAGILEDDPPDQAEAKLAAMVVGVMPGSAEADWVARHVDALAGVGGSGGGAGGDRSEVFAAWRQFFEALAEQRPLVLVFEDLHWADDGMLDFVDYLAGWAGEVPLLVVGTARPELLARRPGWGGGKPNVLTLSLAALSDDDTARLIGSLAGRAVIDAEQHAALLAHAGGNPLFAEQYVQMLADQEDGQSLQLPVPESVQAIIGARLDLLTWTEKRLLHDAAVVGTVFWPGAVAALGDTPDGGGAEKSELERCLHGLERKQFIRRDRTSSVAGQTQYAFVHVLVRDVAYRQIPRAARAGKHIHAAGWIESLGRAADHAEMLAHHYLSAFDLARAANRDVSDLVPRAGAALQAAGDRAHALNAFAAAVGHYRAALALLPEDAQQQRAMLFRQLGGVLFEIGDLSGAETVLAEGFEVAAAPGLSAEQARVRVLLAEIRSTQGRGNREALAECEAAATVLESAHDLEGLAEAWLAIGKLRFFLGDQPACPEALERAGAYARRGGNQRIERESGTWLVLTSTSLALPVPVDVAIDRAEQLLETASGEPWAEAGILEGLTLLYGYAGRFADARPAIAQARAVYRRSGARFDWARSAIPAGEVELVAGHPAEAERALTEGCEAFRAMGERGFLGSELGMLAEAVYVQGRLSEAQRLTEEAEAASIADDIDAQTRWRSTRAKVLACGGHLAAARQLADEAATLSSLTSDALLQAQTLVARAEVNRLAGAAGLAEASLREALSIYEDRRVVPLAERAKTALASLTAQPGAEPG
jgi:tetratricopeptide (TPR) repeat protein